LHRDGRGHPPSATAVAADVRAEAIGCHVPSTPPRPLMSARNRPPAMLLTTP
jgi:hypothetical protein